MQTAATMTLQVTSTSTELPLHPSENTMIMAGDLFSIITHKNCRKENLRSNNARYLVQSQEILLIKP